MQFQLPNHGVDNNPYYGHNNPHYGHNNHYYAHNNHYYGHNNHHYTHNNHANDEVLCELDADAGAGARLVPRND